MKKSDIEAALPRWLLAVNNETARKHIPPFMAPERLRHIEIAGENSWAWRLYPAEWPHIPDEETAFPCPGIRLEVWLYGKREERRFVTLCGKDGLSDLQKELQPVFNELVKGGRFAGRYRTLDSEAKERYPGTTGIQRLSGPGDDKFVQGLAQMIIDAYPVIQQVVEGWNDNGAGKERYVAQAQAIDPLKRLRENWSKS